MKIENKEKMEALLKKLKEQDVVVAYCCCGSKRTTNTHSGC